MSNKYLWRTNQLISIIPEEYDGALIMSEINGKYFTGFNCDNGYFIVTRNGCVFVTDSRYTEAASKAVGWCDVVEYSGPKMKEVFGGISERLGIKRPIMYDLGYSNNNCIGCVKGGMGYWNKIREDFPEVFQARAKLEREIGRSCKNFKSLI